MTSRPERVAPADLPAPVAAPSPRYLEALNPEQRAAVEAVDGPLLVLAGAGTGKTRVLTTRLAHLLLTGRVRPWQVLAVTFTNKAAREMILRVSLLLGQSVEGLWLGTFHALGARLLRRHAELLGLKPNFTILDTDDQLRLTKQVIEAAELDPRRWTPRVLLALIERFKDRGLTPANVPESEISDFALGRTRQLYAAYQERLLTLNACDFGDLLLHGLTLFNEQPEILADYQGRFRALLVDEYQDTNVAQYLWLRLLAQAHKNLTCVGDDDQSIYSWRGAEVGNILRFEQDFPGARVVRLERNYRSTGHILGAASGLIAHNRARLGKTLWTEGEQGQRVRIASLWDDQEEARFVGEEIEAHQRAQGRLEDIAVLVRAGFQTRAFEERFINLGLPYRVIGGPASTSAPRSGTRSLISGWSTSRTTIWRSSGSRTCPSAASAMRPCSCSGAARAMPARACSRPRASCAPPTSSGPSCGLRSPGCSATSSAGASSRRACRRASSPRPCSRRRATSACGRRTARSRRRAGSRT